MIWFSLVLVFLGYAIGLWISVMNGYDPSGVDKPEILRNPSTAIGVLILPVALVSVGLVLAFLEGTWYGIGAMVFLGFLWLVGTEIGHYWIRSIRRDANRRAGTQIFPED